MAVAGAAVVPGCGDDNDSGATATSTPEAATATSAPGATATPPASSLSCVVSPEMTEGPYFVDEMLNRSDIRSDPDSGAVSEGLPLRLALSVQQVDGDTCTPVAGAAVDVWHCDAMGLYSDVEANGTVGQKFLRGYQLTGANGACEFTTIYPGWYTGRTVHIHIKVRTDPDADQGYEFTSQLFFDEAVTDAVYAQPPYNTRGAQDTTNASDGIYQGGGEQMVLPLVEEGDGYAASFSIGLQV
jgi:protocatechuate 3,4-dioxygenase beta subunit